MLMPEFSRTAGLSEVTVRLLLHERVLSTSVIVTLTVLATSSFVLWAPGLSRTGASFPPEMLSEKVLEELSEPSFTTKLKNVRPDAFGSGLIVAVQFGYVPENTTGVGVPSFATMLGAKETASK